MADDISRSIALIISLMLMGGFFAGSETAFSFCNEIRMRTLATDGNRRAKRLVRILDDFDRTIVTLLIAINVIYVSCASVATVACVRIMGAGGSVVATVVITLSVFLFSETIPKNIARMNADAYALLVAYPITFFRVIFKPLAMLFTWFGDFVKHILPKKAPLPDVTEDEFEEIVDTVGEDGLIEPVEQEIIKSTIHFGDIVAESVMTERDHCVGIPVNATQEELKRILTEEKFSRFPVYDGDIDHICGVLRSSAVLWKLMNGQTVDILDNTTRPYIIRPDMPVNKVFEGMSGRHTHMAIVAEQGITRGVLTMEDILEEIVGEIYDEDDVEARAQTAQPQIKKGGASA